MTGPTVADAEGDTDQPEVLGALFSSVLMSAI